jgi:hypothetical protein
MISSSLFVVSFGEDPAGSSEHAVIKQLPIKKSKKRQLKENLYLLDHSKQLLIIAMELKLIYYVFGYLLVVLHLNLW